MGESPVSRVEVRDLGEPEAVVSHPLGFTSQVRLAQTVISRHVLQPGWSWEEHARPEAGTRSCELYHRGVVLSGRMARSSSSAPTMSSTSRPGTSRGWRATRSW
jgi:hypothetical protein